MLHQLDSYLRAYKEKHGSLEGALSRDPLPGSRRIDGIPWIEAEARTELWADEVERVRIPGELPPLGSLLSRARVSIEQARELWDRV
jgi:hypothetical protein